MSCSAPRVMVVDDSSTTRKMVRRALLMAGVAEDAISEAVNGRQALEAIRQSPPSLLCLDVNMPEMTGPELLEVLGAEGYLAGLKVVMITSIASTRQLMNLVRLGATSVVRKPFNPHELVDELAQHLVMAPEPEPEPGELEALGACGDSDGDGADDVGRCIAAAVSTVLAQAAFIDAAPVGTDVPECDILVSATITLSGPVAGEMWAATTLKTADTLAESFVGEPSADDRARIDAVAEFLNILAGQVLLEMEGAGIDCEDVVFSAPERAVHPPGGPGLGGTQAAFSLDGTSATVFTGYRLDAGALREVA